jgi:DNA sulfur modification protein DndB
VTELEAQGWVADSVLKTKTRLRKEKSHDVAFEDRVWAAFARLEFPILNRDRAFQVDYGDGPHQRAPFSVFAADDEVALVVLCRSAESIRSGRFRREIEAISLCKEGLVRRIREEFPGRKVRFALATNNFAVSREVQDRLLDAGIRHISEDAVEYFLGLADHLGSAAKYQLLGAFFSGEKIPNLEPRVPAIRGSMGGHAYYSFAIEPERLLKLSYVLHRNQANSALMPTYQRLIRKSRLKKVAAFVDGGGFFPNSVIVNIETERRGGLRFESAGKTEGTAKLGILHLPPTFRAAYIIDGQHRLYGYAQSDRAGDDLIPVVAFVNLDRSEQVRLFMQINENQQAVPKNLRNTLNSDLLWDSTDHRERARALRLRIAQHLGDKKTSPLYDRILVGENAKTGTRSITIDAISNGLSRGEFIGTFTKTGAKTLGTFYGGDSQSTFDLLTPFLELAFGFLRDQLPNQWALGSSEGGFVFMNNGVEGFLRVLSDVVSYLVNEDRVEPRTAAPEDTFRACRPYLVPLGRHLADLSTEEAAEYRKMYGSGAGLRYYRLLQQAIRAARPEFDPPGLAEWLAAQDKRFVSEGIAIVTDLEAFLKHDVRQRLQDEFHSDWEKHGIPRSLRKESAERAVEKNLDLEAEEELDPWDCLYLIDYKTILGQNGELWRRRFAKRYTRPGDEGLPGSFKKRLSWLNDLNRIRNDTHHGRPIDESDFAFLVELRSWLLRNETTNDL